MFFDHRFTSLPTADRSESSKKFHFRYAALFDATVLYTYTIRVVYTLFLLRTAKGTQQQWVVCIDIYTHIGYVQAYMNTGRNDTRPQSHSGPERRSCCAHLSPSIIHCARARAALLFPSTA
ncbi:Uncharacterized protein APZ42_020343 [Daphnia magna]|uniref:Uncharacterized protein n=1 Tax=Daphnia magna TaxID=35525 RepID=A0A162CLV5_9CRUS|nr:Uncharacterized protein APZ42_020343 [Daphnia magna]